MPTTAPLASAPPSAAPAPLTPAARPTGLARLKRRVQELRLGTQLATCLVGLAALATAVAWTVSPVAGQAAAATALLMGLAQWAWARRTGQALLAVATTASQLAHDDAPDALNIGLDESCDEWRLATARLRLMVEAMQRRQRALEARNLALAGQLAHRTHEVSTLADLSAGLATKTDLGDLVNEALKALEQTMDYTSASLWGREGGAPDGRVVLLGYRTADDTSQPPAIDLSGLRLSRGNLQRYELIERERQPLIDNDARQGLLSWLWEKVSDDTRTSALYRGTRSWMATPLATHDEVVGVMRVDHEDPGYFDAERERLLTAVSNQTALAMRHSRLLAQERELAVMAERNRIARELHDAVSQTLFAANMMAGTMAASAARLNSPELAGFRAQAATLERLNRGALAEMRLLMFELRPDALQRAPLADLLKPTLEALSCRGELQVSADIAATDGLQPEQRLQLYRIAQEALSNAARHSGAQHLSVQWRVHGPGRAELRIADDGCGFDPEATPAGHFGVANMRSRAAEIGATLHLHTQAGAGTEWRLILGQPDEEPTAHEH